MTLAKLIELYDAGFSLREIGEMTGVPWTTVRHRLILVGVEMRPRGGNRKFPPHDEYAKVAFMYVELGWSSNEIAEALGMNPSSIKNRLQVHGVAMRTPAESAKLRWARRGHARRRQPDEALEAA